MSERTPWSVGVDVVNVSDVAAAISRFGDRYIRRVFTADEAAYCANGLAAVAASRFAARFAAKEATVKALAPDWRWSDWRAIEVCRTASGSCGVRLHGEAAALAARRGIDHLALSMSHEGMLATAVVVAARFPRRQGHE
jgi:holo-[acyl-carrier protein] synthase